MDLSYYHTKFHPKRASRFLQTPKSVLGGPYYLQVPYIAKIYFTVIQKTAISLTKIGSVGTLG